MSEIEQMVNEIVSSIKERIVKRFVGGEAIKWILEASPEIVEECLRQHIKELEETNKLLRRDLDEAMRVGKARGLRIKELEEEVRKILCG